MTLQKRYHQNQFASAPVDQEKITIAHMSNLIYNTLEFGGRIRLK
jgi:hypothetical protein